MRLWKKYENEYGRTNCCDIHLVISEDGKLQGRHRSTAPYYLFDVDALIFKAFAQGIKFTCVESFDSDDCELSLKECEY